MPHGVADVLVDLRRAFEDAGVRWYVFGAQAVIAAGVPRLTADVDVTVEVPRGGARALVEVLGRHGIDVRDVGDLATFIAETRVIPAVHRRSALPIDVVLAGPGLEEEMLGRVRRVVVRGATIPFVSTPDLIALKMLAGRTKDLEDVRALLRAGASDLSIDEARKRVRELGVLLDDSALIATFESLAAISTEMPVTKTKTKRRSKNATPRRKR